ncbi:unnamed protein product [Oppiella nova]|uniref:Uncharacterized protein n=1 Tax=Oppiella nova TaxID=334625 RepID=A0A7R9MC39_9ACAR|nr:unnamed protein product [Oppiella nova]CAG2173559.1 unnamed protein product [Oppiella nova]
MSVLNRDLYLSNHQMVYKIPEFPLRIPKAETLRVSREKFYSFKTMSPLLRPNGVNRCEAHVCKELELCIPLGTSYRCLSKETDSDNQDFYKKLNTMSGTTYRSLF